MKPQALLLIVLGLLFGPGYYAFCEKLSGRSGQVYAMTERSDRWTLPDGSILRLRGGRAYKPVPLELTPGDNGYRLHLAFNVTGSNGGNANNYQASLLQGDVGVMERSLKVSGSGNVEVDLAPLRILYPGSYLFVLEEVGAPALAVSGASLRVDTGIEAPRMWIAWSGLALMAAGVGALLRDAWRSRRR